MDISVVFAVFAPVPVTIAVAVAVAVATAIVAASKTFIFHHHCHPHPSLFSAIRSNPYGSTPYALMCCTCHRSLIDCDREGDDATFSRHGDEGVSCDGGGWGSSSGRRGRGACIYSRIERRRGAGYATEFADSADAM